MTDELQEHEVVGLERGLKAVADALRDTLMSPNVSDSNMEAANVVDALDEVAQAIRYGLRGLGNADAATPMGALEAHGLAIKEASEQIASAIRDLADAVREHGSQ